MIRRSVAEDVRQLVAALGDDDEVRREAAIARLRVIGARALDRLLQAYESADRDTRLAILRALETTTDRRVVDTATRAVAEGGDLAAAGVAALRGVLESTDQPLAAAALDALMALALDPRAARRERLAAIEALRELPGLREQLTGILGPQGLGLSAASAAGDAASDAIWSDALDGRLPDTPSVLRESAATHGDTTPPAALRALVEVVREKEAATRAGRRREEWRSVRGALHQALALRGSRIALYDVRETLCQSTGPLPPSFLAALHAAGDGACLEAVAAAYAHAAPGDARWRHQLMSVFRAIAARERLTRRHAVLKRVAARWPDAARDLTAAG